MNLRGYDPMKEWNICDCGAKISGSLQTKAIQKAIDECFFSGGGRVRIPCGVYLTGDIRLRSRVELYLESGAILLGSRNPEDYFSWRDDSIEPVPIEEIGDTPETSFSAVSTSRWSNGLIRAFDAEDIAVIGEKGSYIDGQNCFDREGEEHYRGPHAMSFWRCKRIRLEGYTILNSANWAHAIFKSEDITARNIAVYGGHDGFDVRTCDNVIVEDCLFDTGDDCIAGFDDKDVIVRNCILNSSCKSVRLGGTNVLIENCASGQPQFGLRYRLSQDDKEKGAAAPSSYASGSRGYEMTFGYYCDHRAAIRNTPGNMVFRGFKAEKTAELIRLEFTGLHRWCCNRSLRDVTFEDCEFAGLFRPGMLWGDENEKVTCVFRNCTISCEKGFEKEPLFVAGNYEKIVFDHCRIEGYETPFIVSGTEGALEVIESTPVRVVSATREECMELHPWGVLPADRAKKRTFSLKP